MIRKTWTETKQTRKFKARVWLVLDARRRFFFVYVAVVDEIARIIIILSSLIKTKFFLKIELKLNSF